MIAIYYSRIKYAITENGKSVPTARYDFMRALMQKLGATNVCYVTPDCYDAPNDIFKSHYLLNQDSSLERYDRAVRPALLIDRGFFGPNNPTSSLPIVSNRELRSVSLDKFTMYQTLKEFMPQSVELMAGDSTESMKEMDETFVVKARRGSGGKAVWIMSRTELNEWRGNNSHCDVLVQSLVESDGIEAGLGFAGRHDVRLFVAGDAVVGSYIRRPADGKYISNVNHGGKLEVVSPSVLPTTLIKFASRVSGSLPGGLRIFSIDCFFDREAHEWRVIEINANAGLPSITYGEAAAECLDGIADYIARTYNEMRSL